MTKTKLLCLDCDSTLSAIEGIDELARARGPEIFDRVEVMTNNAMNGKIPVEAVFAQRLEIIRPTRADVEAVGRRYVEMIEPTARPTLAALVKKGWTPVIVSGGFRQVIAPIATVLGVAVLEAVDLFFDDEGNYRGFDEKFPTTHSGGKPEVIERLKTQFNAEQTVMVGDGVSDLEAKPVVDRFIGFGRYTVRPKVRAGAHVFIHSLDELLAIL